MTLLNFQGLYPFSCATCCKLSIAMNGALLKKIDAVNCYSTDFQDLILSVDYGVDYIQSPHKACSIITRRLEQDQ
jgi:hypothetical protein